MTRRIAPLALGAIVVVVALLVLTGGSQGNLLRVQMEDAAGLRKDFLVKIAGAPVGRVADVTLDGGDRAVAELRIEDSAWPVGADARAAIRASNLLGEKYVDLMPGDPRHPAPSGFTIPSSRTNTPTDLDDVLSVLDADTRVALASFLVNQGDALAGRGGDLAAAMTHLPPALDEARELVSGLGRRNRALGTLVERSDRLLASVAPQRKALGRLVGSAAGAFGALGSRRAQLGQTVHKAPAAIRRLRRSLEEIERAAVPLAPAAAGLKQTAGPLTATLRELPAFAAVARPALRTARQATPALERLGREAAPVAHRLQPVAARARTFASQMEPVSRVLDDGIADLLGVLQGWARAVQKRDAAGHIFRVFVEMGGDARKLLLDYVNRPPAERRRGTRKRESRPALPALTPAPAKPVTRVPVPKVRIPKLPGRIEAPVQRRLDTANETASGLLDFLLKP